MAGPILWFSSVVGASQHHAPPNPPNGNAVLQSSLKPPEEQPHPVIRLHSPRGSQLFHRLAPRRPSRLPAGHILGHSSALPLHPGCLHFPRPASLGHTMALGLQSTLSLFTVTREFSGSFKTT